MAHYTVTCEECGCKYEVQLFGKMSDREWHLEHDTHICDDCTAKLRAKRNEEAAKANAEAGLPPLEGTPKQIAWAEGIRAKMVGELTPDNVKTWVASREGSSDEIAAWVVDDYLFAPHVIDWDDDARNGGDLPQVFTIIELKTNIASIKENFIALLHSCISNITSNIEEFRREADEATRMFAQWRKMGKWKL